MATHTYTTGRARTEARPFASRSISQALAVLFGLTFVVIGVAGFIPSLTADAADITTRGPGSPAEVFGVFQTSILHNVVHIGFGVVGLLAASGPRMSRMFLIVGGAAYLALSAYGMWVDMASDNNFLPVNDADNWLHLGLGAAMFILGMLVRRRREDAPREVVVESE